MDQRFAILSVLSIIVVVSGCTGGGGGGTQDQGNTAIAVHELSVSPSEVFAGSNVRVRMSFSNVGQLPAEVLIGNETEGEGSQILTSHCPDIFDVESFSASSSNVSATQGSYILAPGYKVRLNWNLDQSDSSSVPLNGYRCNLRFEVPFNYSVESFKQIQVKEDSEVQSSSNLFAKSSKGPMKLELQTIGSSAPQGAPVFLQSDAGEVLIQLANKEPREGSYTGTINLGPPKVTSRNLEFNGECPPTDKETLQLFQSQSEIFRCGLNWSDSFSGQPSLRAEIFARANYTYVKSAGTKSVKVRYRGQ